MLMLHELIDQELFVDHVMSSSGLVLSLMNNRSPEPIMFSLLWVRFRVLDGNALSLFISAMHSGRD